MSIKNFRLNILIRIILIICLLAGLEYYIFIERNWIRVSFLAFGILVWAWEFFRYSDRTNRDLSNFLLALNHDDYAGKYDVEKKGKSFHNLYTTFASINEKYRQLAAQKEVQFVYLQTLVEHIKVGILCFDDKEEIQLANQAFKDLIKKPYLAQLNGLSEVDKTLFESVIEIKPGERRLVRFVRQNQMMELVIRATEFKLYDVSYKLISIQDIKTELEEKELQAWQRLIRVLTHEIVNSVTPISTLSTALHAQLQQVSGHSSDQYLGNKLDQGLNAIKDRSNALLEFTQAYQKLTRIPTPDLKVFKISNLLRRIELLFVESLAEKGVNFTIHLPNPNLELLGDLVQLEQVLINLIKNALDAVLGVSNPFIELTVGKNENQQVFIEITDNGAGIDPEIMDQIFIPFFTTKETGSGVGLSLSRQIMLLHKGDLQVESEKEKGSQFRLIF